MSSLIPAPLGALSHDLILACDGEMIVREANALAVALLGRRVVGQPLLRLFAMMARPKAGAFLAQLRDLPPDATTEPWELLFHVPRATPLLANVRGGVVPCGGWLIVGSCPSPQLTTLYHEVLTINNELTNLVRQLSKEQALLSSRINRLLQAQE